MRCIVLALAIALVTAGTNALAAEPPGVASLNSQLFVLTSWCTGRDMVFRWSVDGKEAGDGVQPPSTQYGRAYIYPWLDADIMVRGVEVTVSSAVGWKSLLFGPAHFRWLMVGNNASGDIMISLPRGALHGVNWYPAGTGFFFPDKRRATPLTYIDLHGACSPWDGATVYLNLYYTMTPPL